MTKDLERTIDELGPEYRAVVGRLRAAYEPSVRRGCAGVATVGRQVRFGRVAAYLVAASLLVAFAVGLVFRAPERQEAGRVYTVNAVPSADKCGIVAVLDDESIREIIRTQGADGGWKTDFLTRRNAEALKNCHSEEARTAYRKAIINLRRRGAL